MKKTILTFLLFFGVISNLTAQIKGTITGLNQEALTNVNIYLADTYTGTTTNTNGAYELTIAKTGNYTVVFQYLGYKTLKKDISITKLPYTLDITLEESEVSLISGSLLIEEILFIVWLLNCKSWTNKY